MTINAGSQTDTFNMALELFSSLYEDMASTDLPAGLSPDNQDIWFLPGSAQTRPALNKFLNTPPLVEDVVALTEYQAPSGDYLWMWAYADGSIYQRSARSTVVSLLTKVSPGCQFRSVTAFNKQWFAFFNEIASQSFGGGGFSDSPFVGFDVPRYFDGQNVWRVTQDAPAINPVYSNLPTLPINLVASGATGSVAVTAVTSSGAQTQTVTIPGHWGPPYTESGPTWYPPFTYTETIYTTITYTCATSIPGTWPGSQITVTGCTGTNSSLVNVTGIANTASSGTTLILNVSTGTTLVHLTGQSATASAGASGNYLVRSGNIVTAYTGSTALPQTFQRGLYVQVINSDGSQINGPNWAIATIERDSTGLVTVTLSVQLTNLASGTVLYIASTDTTNFPASFEPVYQVLSASGGQTVFTISDPTWGSGSIASSTGGDVYQQWSGTFEILSTGVDGSGNNYFTYFQLGPDTNLATPGGTPQAQIEAQMAPGPRSAVIFFKSVDGAETAPSQPIQLSINGGTNLLSASQIPIGPPGTAQRVVAFTPAYGASFFYITPSYIPSAAGISPVLSLGTIINDNTSTSAIFDFSDAELTAGTAIDVQGNDLFNQIVLAPCLGCIEYEGRMGWWGEINNVKNLINAGFNGGYVPTFTGTVNTSGATVTLVTGSGWADANGLSFVGAQINIAGKLYKINSISSGTVLQLTTSAGSQSGVPFFILSPLFAPIPGWTSISAYLVSQSDQSLGFAAQLWRTTSGIAAISQPCYQDFYGGPILEPNTAYTIRFWAALNGGDATSTTISVTISSPTLGVLGSAPVTGVSPTGSWVTAFLPTMPAVIPTDVEITLAMLVTTSGPAVTTLNVDEFEIIDTMQPVLYNQMRLSYFNNPFGYDDETGLIAFDGPNKITAAFKQRSYLYALTDGPMYQTQNNGTTEPNGWSFPAVNDECDCFGPNAVTYTEDVAWWVGQSGFRVFSGATPKKLSQEIQPTWELLSAENPPGVWACNDPEERIIYIGAAAFLSSEPSNIVLTMSYRAVDSAYNVPDPLHISYSGKLITSDLCRKWTRWNIPMLCGAILHQSPLLVPSGPSAEMFFGGQEFGNLYSLNFSKYTDDDYGQIFSYYVTYFFFNHEVEQGTPQLGLHQKFYAYLTAYITGVGTMQPQLLMNNLNNPWGTYPTLWDPVNIKWTQSGSLQNPLAAVPLTNGALANDLEWGLNINSAARLAIKFAPQPLAGQTDAAFTLTHCVLSARQQAVAPIRGSNT